MTTKTEIPLADVIDKYDEGESPYQIAKFFDTYPNRIRRMLEKAEHPLRNKSAAQKASIKIGTSEHPTEGKQRSEEDRMKISSAMCDHWDNMSDEERQKRADISRENWEKLTDEERARINALGVEAVRRAATEGSKAENMIADGLEKAGYRLRRHDKNLIPQEKLEIDLYIPDLNVIIEVDGPSHFEPIRGEEALQKQVQFDLKKNGTLLSKGFIVIRVKAVKKPSLSRVDGVIKQIVEILESVKTDFPEETKRFIEVEL